MKLRKGTQIHSKVRSCEGTKLAESESQGVWFSIGKGTVSAAMICTPHLNRVVRAQSFPGAENDADPRILEPRLSRFRWFCCPCRWAPPGSLCSRRRLRSRRTRPRGYRWAGTRARRCRSCRRSARCGATVRPARAPRASRPRMLNTRGGLVF